MNLPPYEVVEMPAKPLHAESGDGPSSADVERGLQLFILAAASFLRDASATPRRGRRSADRQRTPPRGKPVVAAKKRAGSRKTSARRTAKPE